jgi:membrane-associated phospholipid phosphatase/tRNA A-37 threonylcarbamoyl transferase component Bud32
MTDRVPTSAPRPQHLADVAEEMPLLPIGRRRRPSAEGRRYPIRLRVGGWAWLMLALLVVASWGWLLATGGPASTIERVDSWVLHRFVDPRIPVITEGAKFLALLGSIGVVMTLRWGTILVLVVTERLRHLVTFIVAALTVRIVASVLALAIGRPRPLGVVYAYGWEGYSHPSRTVAALAVAAVGACFALAPRGPWRRGALGIAAVAIALLSIARVYLGIDHPSDVIAGAVLGVAFAIVPFRVSCPGDVFPVIYRRKRAAHLEIDDRRRTAITEATQEQVDLDVEAIEPFGEEGSGGSTPLRLEVRRSDGREDVLFGKLYAETHLRADRWYKLGRAIRYGALEDEVMFSSVRQLVEYEDYMLRVMDDAGIPCVKPRGIVEIDPDREYLILMTFLHDAEEADEDATVTDAVIASGLRVIRMLWDHGLAHRDIKPANVLIKDDEVFLIDVAFGQVRPSPWRQAVDLANMMLVLALGSDAEPVYAAACEIFAPEDVAEAFAATKGITMPRELRDKLKEDGRNLPDRFREFAPGREPIAIQRWSLRRILLTARVVAVGLVLGALVVTNLASLRSP